MPEFNSNLKIKHLFNAYYRALVTFANTFLLDMDECEDVVQSAFLQLWESNAVFNDETAVRSYLYKTVKNKCFNKLRHYKVKEKYRLQNVPEQVSNELINKDVIVEDSTTKVLHTAINLLAPRKKQVIQLGLKGLSNKEIADSLSIGLETVKSQKFKAYKMLRLHLKTRFQALNE